MPLNEMAATPAKAVATALCLSLSQVINKASNASVPANANPHCVGTWAANAMPTKEATFQLTQFTSAAPEK